MGMKQLFFSFKGRVRRGLYWLVILIAMWPMWVATINDLALLYGWRPPFFRLQDTMWAVGFAIASLYLASAISSKRLHDRNRTHWWLVPLLFSFIMALPYGTQSNLFTYFMTMSMLSARDMLGLPQPIVALIGSAYAILYILSFLLSLWLFIEMGFSRGTNGDNKYGPDPLAPLTPPEGETN